MDLETVDVHVAGTAVRLVTAGLPAMSGDSFAGRAEALDEAAGPHLVALCREPRGHGGTILAVLAEPDRTDADAGMVFFNGGGMLPFSGEGLIGATASALERRLIVPRNAAVVHIETIPGDVRVRPLTRSDGSLAIRYTAGPATIVLANQPLLLARRNVRADVVWAAGECVAIVDAEAAGAPLVPARLLELQRAGAEVFDALDTGVRLVDPVSGTTVRATAVVFIGAPPEHLADVLSGTVVRDGGVSRSPGGTATVAIATVLSAMTMLLQGQRLVHQGIGGTTLGAEIAAVEDRDGRIYVTVDIDGEAWPLGRHVFSIAPRDPLAHGVRFL